MNLGSTIPLKLNSELSIVQVARKKLSQPNMWVDALSMFGSARTVQLTCFLTFLGNGVLYVGEKYDGLFLYSHRSLMVDLSTFAPIKAQQQSNLSHYTSSARKSLTKANTQEAHLLVRVIQAVQKEASSGHHSPAWIGLKTAVRGRR